MSDAPYWKVVPYEVFIEYLQRHLKGDDVEEPESVNVTDLLAVDDNTFAVRVRHGQMNEAKVCEGDWLIVNRALKPVAGKAIVVEINNKILALTMYKQPGKYLQLVPAGEKPIEFVPKSSDKVETFGLVTRIIHEP